MNEKLSYRSHAIELELIEIRPQRFRWLCIVDATHLSRSDDVLQPMHAARIDALAKAFGDIDALEGASMTALEALAEKAASVRSALRSEPLDGTTTAERREEARRAFVRRSLLAERGGATFDRMATRYPEPPDDIA